VDASAQVPIDLGKQAWELEQLEKDNMSILHDLGLAHVADTKFGGPNARYSASTSKTLLELERRHRVSLNARRAYETQVRGLSGGQRRRVTLAKGIVSWPHLLFCDEPTSGLSARAAASREGVRASFLDIASLGEPPRRRPMPE
jgi:ATPase subunit of ABC transporter with duplicated ATPase domains